MIALLRRFGPMLVIAALVAAALLSGVTKHLTFGELEAHRQGLRAFVADHPVLSVGAFIAAYAAMALTALPGPLVFTIAGGLLFGFWVGGFAVLIGANLGSALLFLVCKSAFGDVIRRRAGPRADKVKAMLTGNMFEHVLILRVMPVFPLGFITIGAALAGAPLRTFVAASVLGMVPSTIVYTGLGSGLNRKLDQGGRITPGDFADPQIILPLFGLAALAALPLVVRKWKDYRRAKQQIVEPLEKL